uniref:Uncharacterized protein n=1 Tax=Fagus sylvatica TaxID=28930 RepID=A0A2N9ELK2_FAGSY
MAVLVQTPVRDRRLAMRDRTPVVHDRDLAAYARGLAVLVQTPVRDLAILIMNGSIRSLAWFSVNVDEPMGIATRDGGGFGLPIWWWGLGYGVAGVVVVAVGGQSGRWVLRRRRCLGWGLVDTVVWGLRFGIWVCSASDGEMGLGFGFWVSPTAKWLWPMGC